MQNVSKEFQEKYTIISILDEKETYSLYEVKENSTGLFYAAKYYRLNLFWQALGSLKQQLEKLAADEIEFLPNIYDIGEEGNELYVVTEKIEGQKLSEIINKKEKHDVKWVLEIIKKIADGISYFNKNGISMYMINPNNIYIQEDENKENISLKFSNIISGNYGEEKDNDFMLEQAVYMAPEQLGLSRKKNDVRSDLYSLGIIAYQLLVGRLPFRAKTINQYMYLQIAQIPSPVSQYNSDVKGNLDQMILCLLEKDPNSRYQSVESLLYDIREYLSGNIHFVCKSYDAISKVLFREKDFLPCDEMDTLDRLLHDGKGFAVISGEKNTGKSVVLDYVKLNISNHKNTTLFEECGHRNFNIDIMWGLLSNYAKVFVTYPLRRQDILRQQITKQGNVSKQMICSQDKEYEIFFAEQYEGKDAGNLPEETQLLHLWKAISVVEEHLVVLFKNLTVDQRGTKLLDEFYSCFEIMFLAVTSQKEVKGLQKVDFNIHLQKITQECILKSLNRVTSYRLEEPEELAKYVYKRSLGNVYLTTEVANWLFNKDALSYREGRWRTNPLVLFDLGLPTEISQEIIEKRDMLSAEALKMLYILATVEGILPWTYVKRVAEIEGIETEAVIEELQTNQYVEEKIKDTLYIAFTDNAIYDFFRAQLSKNDLKYYSQKIAEVLEQEYIRFHKAEEAIAMNRYYLKAQNNEKIKEYSFEAAMFLKNQGKNMKAIEVLNGFLNALEYQDDEIILFYKAQKMAGEIYIAEGKPEEAEKTFEELLKLDLTSEMRADILEERSWAAFYKGKFQEALDFLKAVMREKKQYIPRNTPALYAGILYQSLIRIGQTLWGEKKQLHPPKRNRAIKDNISQNVWWVSLLVDVRYFTYFSLWTTNLNWAENRKSQELVMSYFNLGQALLSTPFQKTADKYLTKAMELAEELGNDHLRVISYTILAYRCEVVGDYEGQLNYALRALHIHKKLQFSSFYGMTMNALIYAYNYLGDFNNMLRYNEFYQKRSQEIGDNYGMISSSIYYLQYHRAHANFVTAYEYGEKALDLAVKIEDYFNQFCSCAELGITYLLSNQEEKAIFYFEKAMEIKKDRHFPIQFTLLPHSYYVIALCKKQRKIQQSFPDDISLYSLIKKNLDIVLSKKRYTSYFGVALRAKAEWNVLQGKHQKAQKYFRESIESTVKLKRPWVTAITQMAYGQYLAENGENSSAMQEFILAEYNFRNLKVDNFALLAQKELENIQFGSVGIDFEFNKFQKRFQRERKNMFFTDLVRELSSVLDYRELIQKMIMVLLEASGAQQIVVFTPAEKTGELKVEEIYASETLKIKNKEEIVSELPMNLIRTAQHTREVFVLEDAAKSAYAKMDEVLSNKHIKSMMLLPICYKNNLQAICYLENSLSTGIFTNEVVESLKILANQMAVSLENAMLYQIATTDDLTGLYTRKHFDYLFGEELRNAKENGSNLGIVFIDIDKFKSINDTYGHIIGDKVLIEFSKFLKNNCRMTDIIGRFGGEEIILLLRGNSGVESFAFAERLRQKLENYPIETASGNLKITASFGISSFPEHGDSMVELINKADTALYCSKNEGRNRVSIAK